MYNLHTTLKIRLAYLMLFCCCFVTKSAKSVYRNFIYTNHVKLSSGHMHISGKKCKPKASEVLSSYILQCKEPPWTSYFVKYENILDDQWGKSHFNWQVGSSNYHILRTGCYPYIKYHCTKRCFEDLQIEDTFFRIIKCMNLGIPCLAYGIAATFLIKHTEIVFVNGKSVPIYFLYEEDKGSLY